MRLFKIIILSYSFVLLQLKTQANTASDSISFNFYGTTIATTIPHNFKFSLPLPLNDSAVPQFYNKLSANDDGTLRSVLLKYKQQNNADDWLFYQLVRRVAESICPKTQNYQLYTLYKWYLMATSGYDATISKRDNRLLLYLQSDEPVYNIPYHLRYGKQYVCMNYHDYGTIDFEKEQFVNQVIVVPAASRAFTFKITSLPNFDTESYQSKNLQFDYGAKEYRFKVLINEQVKNMFANYPVVDYESYFNIPLSKKTYASLIPVLRENLKKMTTVKGVDYIMHFTRYAFAFETDTKVYGQEKRLSPEQTLLYDYSDCEDRAALFFFLVKEIYNLPMITLAYASHVTIAVKFDAPIGKEPIMYKGNAYTVCEPTPQASDLRLGKMIPSLRKEAYEVVYEYNPR